MKLAPSWRIALPLAILVVMGLLALFFDTARSIVTLWDSSETYAHGYFIVPVSIVLIWQQRKRLGQIAPQPSPLGLLALAGLVFLWLLGALSGAQVVMQYALAAMIPAAALALLGWAAVRVMMFPLLFVLLAVPFGDAFIDPLIDLTADFTTVALKLTGVAVYREGNTLTLSSGVWSVVEACSGVRYLIASVTLGIIYAYITYRHFWRRAAFVLAAIIVPIFANGARAYLIVMIGHLSDMKYATGVDHLIYGWLFFGLVMLLLFWVGGFWREDAPPAAVDTTGQASGAPASAQSLIAFALAILLFASIGPAYSVRVSRTLAQQPPVALSEADIPGWQRAAAFTTWYPQYKNPTVAQMRFLARDGEQAGIFIGYYRNQSQQSELIGFGNVLATPSGKLWRRLSESTRDTEPLAVHQNLLAHDTQRLRAWYWYWVGDRFTTNSYEAKAYLAWHRLLMQRDDSAVIIVFTPDTRQAERADKTLQQLLRDALPTIERQLQAARAE